MSGGAKRIARRTLTATSLHTDRWWPSNDGVVLLIYHRVGAATDSPIDLPTASFDTQLRHLREHADVVTLDAAIAALDGTDERDTFNSGRPRVVLTFDDGTDDFTDIVVPLLVTYGLPATLYAATAFIAEQRPFPWGSRPTSAAALADATTTGLITIESHSHSHPSFADLSLADAADELTAAHDLIASWTDRAPTHFAYPRAIPPGAPAEVAVRRQTRTAALAGSGTNTPSTDRHRLRRTPVLRNDSAAVFARRAAGGMRLEGAARAAALRLRHRALPA
jgi:peptidoglycan/xylan/chitin deacetylase (PgdA/CDA1 family)